MSENQKNSRDTNHPISGFEPLTIILTQIVAETQTKIFQHLYYGATYSVTNQSNMLIHSLYE